MTYTTGRLFWDQLRAGEENRLHPNRARRLFFAAVDDLKPEVRESLRTDVLPKLKEMLEALRDRGVFNERDASAYRMLHRVVRLTRDDVPDEPHLLLDEFYEWYQEAVENQDSAVESLQKALDDWANRYHINTAWVIRTALCTVWMWQGLFDGPRDVGVNWFIPDPVNIETRRTLPTYGEGEDYVELPDLFDVTIQTLDDVKKRYIEAFEEVLDERLDKLTRLAREKGIPMVSPGGKADHIDWLVRFQVCEESKSTIANDADRDRRTVGEAIDGLLAFLDLTERPESRGGRPRGSKTKHRVQY